MYLYIYTIQLTNNGAINDIREILTYHIIIIINNILYNFIIKQINGSEL